MGILPTHSKLTCSLMPVCEKTTDGLVAYVSEHSCKNNRKTVGAKGDIKCSSVAGSSLGKP